MAKVLGLLFDSPLRFIAQGLPTNRMATLQSSSEDTRVYELCVLYPFPLNQKEEQDILKGIEELLSEAKAKVILKDVWGRRGLAYPVKGYREGSFVMYYVEMDPSELKEIDNQLKIMKGVLRHLVVKPPKGYKIVPMAGRYEEWKQQAKVEGERKAAEKEEKLKKQVLEKAKRQFKKSDAEKAKVEKPAAPKGDISKKLDQLISDDAIEL
jgi:small subunit ribosomal protein S6